MQHPIYFLTVCPFQKTVWFKLIAITLTSLIFSSSFAQTLPKPVDADPTRWIDYTQSYYKIPIAETGLYRITAAELSAAGIRTDQLDPTTIQLFRRGVEQAIYVKGEVDKRFDPDDFLEFYGRKNDGAQDSLLYQPRRSQPHAYYSLFSDTAAYFLTWRLDGKPGKRMDSYTDTTYATMLPEPYHWEEELRIFTDTYPAGTIYPLGAGYENGAVLTNYDTGEGWTGPVVNANSRYDQAFTLTNYSPIVDRTGKPVNPRVSYLLVGRNPYLHHIRCLAGPSTTALREIGTVNFANYENARLDTELRPSDIAPSGSVIVCILPQEEGEEVSVSYLRIQYPQPTDLAGANQREFHLQPNAEGRSFLELTNASIDTRLFDISDPDNVEVIHGNWANGYWRGVVHNAQTSRRLLAINQPRSVPGIQPVAFRQIDPQAHNYLIVTHPLLRKPTATETDPVRAYAAYRTSEAGGNYDTLTVDINQLFDQFSYGERHPLAIRRFAGYMLRGGSLGPKFLFLIGQSRDPQSVRKLPNAALLDLLPNAGWPGSDIGLVEGLNGEATNVPAIPTGRLNTANSQSVLDYLNKVKEHENTPEPALWRKQVLHLSGGRSRDELQTFRSFVDDFKSVIEAEYAGACVTTRSKQTDNLVESLLISDLVNQGVGIISLFGHSSLDVNDIDIGFVSNDLLNYRNKGRYPFLLVNGCAAGNFYFGRPTFGSDWILTPDRGAVLFLAHTYNGFPTPLKSYSDHIYALMADSQYVGRPIGMIQQEAIRRYLNVNTTIFDITTAQQMTLQGDPALRVFPYATPDFSFASGSLRIRNSQGDSLTAKADSARISGIIVNYGRVTNSPLTLRIRHYEASGQLLTEQQVTQPAPFYADTLNWLVPIVRAATPPSYFELIIDPDNRITESNEQNNNAQISTDGSANDLPFPVDLIPPLLEVAFDGQRIGDGDIVSAQPTIALLLQDENLRLLRTDTTGLELYLQRPCPTGGCPYERLWLRENVTHWAPADSTNAFRLNYQFSKPLVDGLYTFVAVGNDLSGNRAAPYQIHFSVRNQPELIGAGAYPNPLIHQTRFFVSITGVTPPANLTVRISDLQGRLVRMLRGPSRVGLNEWVWDGTADDGSHLPAGVYLYHIDSVDLQAPNDTPFKRANYSESMSQARFLWVAYSSLGVAMAGLILLNPNHFKSIDSVYYLQSATNLLAGHGYVVQENGQFIWNGTFPIGYSALISVVSDLTGLPVLIASKLVNYLAVGVSGHLWTRRLGVSRAIWVVSIWALGSFLKIAVYTWSETVFLVLLAEWVWCLHLFLRNPVANRAFILFLIGYALFLIRYIGGFVFGLTGILTLLVWRLPDRIRTQLGITQTRSIVLNLLISLAAGVLSMSAYFWMNRQLSGSFFGGERFISIESALELTKIFGWAMLNECLLIRDFVQIGSNKLAWIGLCIQLLLFGIVYGQQHQHQLPGKKESTVTPLIWLFLFTAGIYVLVLFSFRTSSPFSNPNLRLMAPFTFCFLWAGGLWIGTWPTHWQKNLFPYWLLLLLCSWLQLLPQTDLSQKISLLWNW